MPTSIAIGLNNKNRLNCLELELKVTSSLTHKNHPSSLITESQITANESQDYHAVPFLVSSLCRNHLWVWLWVTDCPAVFFSFSLCRNHLWVWLTHICNTFAEEPSETLVAEDKKKDKNKEAHLFTRIVIQQVKEIYLFLSADLHIFLDGLVGEGSHEKIKKGGYESQNTSKHLKIIHHYNFV